MKRLLKVTSFGILPLLTLISFTIIGKISEQRILARQGAHPTMTGIISFTAWVYRGIYGAVLIVVFFYVLHSKLSKSTKTIVFLLMLILNLPLMYFMNFAIYLPLGLLLIPVVNLIALIPAFIELR